MPGRFIWGNANATIDKPDLTHLNAGHLNRCQKLGQMSKHSGGSGVHPTFPFFKSVGSGI